MKPNRSVFILGMLTLASLHTGDTSQLIYEKTKELHRAAEKGDLSTIKRILKSGIVDVNTIDYATKKTPLMSAIHSKQLAIVAFLIDAKADIAAVDADGNSALHHAIRYVNQENNPIVSLLVSHNPKLLNIANNNQQTAIDLAATVANSKTAVQLLLDAGATLKPYSYYAEFFEAESQEDYLLFGAIAQDTQSYKNFLREHCPAE